MWRLYWYCCTVITMAWHCNHDFSTMHFCFYSIWEVVKSPWPQVSDADFMRCLWSSVSVRCLIHYVASGTVVLWQTLRIWGRILSWNYLHSFVFMCMKYSNWSWDSTLSILSILMQLSAVTNVQCTPCKAWPQLYSHVHIVSIAASSHIRACLFLLCS